ncbi:MAG TPA: porin family protein [Cyclobacteriaceae bacterium]|nr:porin family protein [Cyclobacteriaceae bacterium]
MKKILLTLSMTALVISGAIAQEISGGAKAGLNIANMTGDIPGVTSKASFHLGGYVNIGFSDVLSLQPELLYNAMGAKEDGGDGKINSAYISVPVMVLYSFGVVNVQAGPQFGFLLSAKVKADGDEQDIKDQYKGTDFGFNLGLGADFGKFNAAARYCIGLSNIADASDIDVKNSVIQFSLGVKLFGE